MDTDALKHTWGLAEKVGDEVPLYFYAHLFHHNPELRALFPVSMATQRDRLVAALGRIVSRVDEVGEVVGFIEQLGRDHRRFQVVAEHFDAVGGSLLATLEHFLGSLWTPKLAADWAEAYGLVATVMVNAALESETTSPPWWRAEVLSVDRRSVDIAVLQARPDQPLAFRPGQSIAVEVPQLPRMWRYLSPANAPRSSGTLEFHVQRVPGGQVSAAVLGELAVGDVLRLGSPVGERLTLPADHEQDLLLVAGATGLAPLRAHLEAIDQRWQATGRAPRVHLFHGARHPWNLYEDALLTQLATRPWFDYTPVVSEEPTYPGVRGLVGDVAARAADWRDRTALVCGSSVMVQNTRWALEAAGMDRNRIRFEQFVTRNADTETQPVHDRRHQHYGSGTSHEYV